MGRGGVSEAESEGGRERESEEEWRRDCVKERVRGVRVGLSRFCSHIRPLWYNLFPTTGYYALGWVLLCSVNKLLCLEFNDLIIEESHRCVVVITRLIPTSLP